MRPEHWSMSSSYAGIGMQQDKKIRHVPATLPDMLKTPELIEWEYRDFIGRTSRAGVRRHAGPSDWLKNRGGDYEIALALPK